MSTITTIQGTDVISTSRSTINTNFSNLNADKIETSYLDTDTTLAANSDSKIATQKAVKAYVDAGGNVNASTTVKGIVEEATAAEVLAKTATGGTGARLFVNPSTLTDKISVQTFLASGTYTKPSGLARVLVRAWGGGGSGARTATAANECGGGGGGGFAERWIEAATIGTTETVTIGAGGAAKATDGAGNAGANTTFGSLLTAYGGGAGDTGATGGGGGGGGGAMGVGGNASAATAGAAGAANGGIGGDGGSTTAPVSSLFGGGGGQAASSDQQGKVGASAYYGGAGGGGAGSGGSASGGTSVHGGAGGAGNNAASGNATSGTQPGGGGGAKWSNAGSGSSGAGADGQVTVIEFYA